MERGSMARGMAMEMGINGEGFNGEGHNGDRYKWRGVWFDRQSVEKV